MGPLGPGKAAYAAPGTNITSATTDAPAIAAMARTLLPISLNIASLDDLDPSLNEPIQPSRSSTSRAGHIPADSWFAATGARECPPSRPVGLVSAELLGQSDDDALGATQEAEPVDVLVLRDLSDEFRTVAAQAGNDVVDVLDGEHDAAYAQRVRRRALGLGSDRRRRVELRQLNPAVAVRGPHHGEVGTNVVEPFEVVARGIDAISITMRAARQAFSG